MSRPLWPEDMETLCPSVRPHMRHALAIYCNILLHVAVWPQTVAALRGRSISACLSLLALSLFLLSPFCSLSLSALLLFYVWHFCSPYHSSFSSFLVSSATQQLQT